MRTGEIVVIILLVLACAGMIVWLYFSITGLNKCQTNEHLGCPSYFCEYTVDVCRDQTSTKEEGVPFRKVDGNIVCQGKDGGNLKSTVTSAEDRDNWDVPITQVGG